MGFFYINLLAVVQGVTEFLPISSSGHLFILSKLFKEQEHSLQVDVAVHLGTLLAIIIFYKNDFESLLSGIKKNMLLQVDHKDAQFLRLIILSALPVVLVGFFLHVTDLIDEIRSIKTIGWGMIIFGVILYLADKRGQKYRLKSDWSFKDALIMGIWQAFALIPGTSRSGNTISGAMFLGFARESSVNLSLLMSIPTIFASSLLLVIDLVRVDFKNSNLIILILSCFLAFVASLVTLNFLVNFIKTRNFTPFVIYRLTIGFLILYIAYN